MQTGTGIGLNIRLVEALMHTDVLNSLESVHLYKKLLQHGLPHKNKKHSLTKASLKMVKRLLKDTALRYTLTVL